MYGYFLFLGIFEIVLTDKVLKNRGITLTMLEKIMTFLFILIIIQYCIIICGDIYYLMRIVFSIPILFIVSYTDIKYRLVFDEDLICGIIVQVGIVLIFMIIDMVFIKKSFPIEFDCTFTEKITSLYKKDFYGYLDVSQFNYFSKDMIFLIKNLKDNIFAAIVIFVVSCTLSKTTKSIGMGDVLYFSFVASFGNIYVSFFIFFASFIASGLYCIFLNILDKKSFFDGLISFTPFISVGLIISLCL